MKQYNILDDVLIIPEGVKELTSKIMKNQRSEFKKVYISSSVEKIEDNTFCNNCEKLQEIVVSPDNPYFSSLEGVLYSKDKLTLIRFPKGKKDVEFSIPSGVTDISSHAFCKCRILENIVTPSSLETIGKCAFNLGIVKLTIQNDVHERNVIMLKEWINHIEIGSSVKYIINGAFDKIGGLIEIKVSVDNSNYSSEDGVLFSKDRTKLIKFPQYKNLKNYSIPSCVREICDYAFYGCKYLEVVEIPKEVRFISTMAFVNCELLREIKLSNENNDYINKDGFLFNKNMTKLLRASKIIEELKHYSIPNGVIEIGGSAFRNGTSLQSIDIPNSVKMIGEGSFYGCTSLQSIDIPSSVEIIGDSSFEYCSSLQSIDIPNSVKKIGERAFFNCSSLQSIDIPSSVEVIGKSSFQYCDSLQSIEIPNSVTEIGDRAFSGCSSLKNVDIPNSVKDIGESAFENCKSLRNIDIPNSVEVIGEGTFRDCTSLQNVDIPNSIKKIGERAFIGCSSLQSINVPNSVEEIESSAFNACSSLLEILVSLDNDYYMSDNGILFNKNGTSLLRVPIGMNLKQYSISTKVKSIGDGAFSGCTSLQGVDIPSSVTEIGDRAFAACRSLQGINIPDSVKEIGKSAFLNCNSLQTVEIPNGVTEIRPMSFKFCHSLRNIYIPNSVVKIGGNAFYNCLSLESIEIPNSVMSLSDFSYEELENLRKIIINIEDIDKCEVSELKGVNFNDCILYVPSGTRWSYRHHPVFGKFKNIEILHAKR